MEVEVEVWRERTRGSARGREADKPWTSWTAATRGCRRGWPHPAVLATPAAAPAAVRPGRLGQRRGRYAVGGQPQTDARLPPCSLARDPRTAGVGGGALLELCSRAPGFRARAVHGLA